MCSRHVAHCDGLRRHGRIGACCGTIDEFQKVRLRDGVKRFFNGNPIENRSVKHQALFHAHSIDSAVDEWVEGSHDFAVETRDASRVLFRFVDPRKRDARRIAVEELEHGEGIVG